MTRDLLVSVAPGEVRALLLEDGVPVEIAVERETTGAAGEVRRGRVTRVAPLIEAAFVDIGIGREGFLGRSDARLLKPAPPGGGRALSIGELVTEGEAVVVQVTRDALPEATGGKSVKLSAAVSLPGRFLIHTPREPGLRAPSHLPGAGRKALLDRMRPLLEGGEGGFILRTAAVSADEETVAREAEVLRAVWSAALADRRSPPTLLVPAPGVVERLLLDLAATPPDRVTIDAAAALAGVRAWCARHAPDWSARLVHGPVDEESIDAEIEAALGPEVKLAGGGSLVIEATAALAAIDVNVGGDPRRVEEVNRTAAAEIARQVRLRNLGGQIVIDFVSMKDAEARRRVVEALRNAVAGDPAHPHILGMTRLGLVEMVRPRRKPSLAERMMEPTPPRRTAETIALEALRAALRTVRSDPAAQPALRAAPAIVAALKGELAPAVREAERRLGHPLDLQPDTDLDPDRYDITTRR